MNSRALRLARLRLRLAEVHAANAHVQSARAIARHEQSDALMLNYAPSVAATDGATMTARDRFATRLAEARRGLVVLAQRSASEAERCAVAVHRAERVLDKASRAARARAK